MIFNRHSKYNIRMLQNNICVPKNAPNCHKKNYKQSIFKSLKQLHHDNQLLRKYLEELNNKTNNLENYLKTIETTTNSTLTKTNKINTNVNNLQTSTTGISHAVIDITSNTNYHLLHRQNVHDSIISKIDSVINPSSENQNTYNAALQLVANSAKMYTLMNNMDMSKANNLLNQYYNNAPINPIFLKNAPKMKQGVNVVQAIPGVANKIQRAILKSGSNVYKLPNNKYRVNGNINLTY